MEEGFPVLADSQPRAVPKRTRSDTEIQNKTYISVANMGIPLSQAFILTEKPKGNNKYYHKL